MVSLKKKAQISAESALLFALINLPFTYRLTDQVLPFSTYDHVTSCPTTFGLLVHTLIFFLVTYFTMGGTKGSAIKLKHSLYSTLIFFLISSPAVYSLVGSLLGPAFADSSGCPTFMGVLLHALVYFLALIAVMYLP